MEANIKQAYAKHKTFGKRKTFGEMLKFMRAELRETHPDVAVWLGDWLDMYYKCMTRVEARAFIRKFQKQAQRVPVLQDLYREWEERSNDMEINTQKM